MRGRVLGVAAVTAAVGLYLLLAGGGPRGSSEGPDSARATSPVRAVAEPAAAPSSPPRNVFEYADGIRPVEAAPRMAVAASVAPKTLVAPPAPPSVRLVGVLRQGTQVKAALAFAGETVILASGESAAGYTVLGIDDDEGVRVRTPDGSSIVLAPAPDR